MDWSVPLRKLQAETGEISIKEAQKGFWLHAHTACYRHAISSHSHLSIFAEYSLVLVTICY